MKLSAILNRLGQSGRFIGVFALLWVACGTRAHAEPLRAEGGGYELQVLADGQPLSRLQHRGEDYVLGRLGARYSLRVINHSERRIEAVVSVDGLDVIDGKPADFKGKRGYLVPAYGSVDIEGWRLSEQQVAAFRFAAATDSYAQQSGSPRNIGVIGAAIFPERYVPPPVAIPLRPPMPRYDRAWPEAAEQGAAPAASMGRQAEPSRSAQAPASEALSDARASAPAPTKRRSGLGTEFGEAMRSQVTEVEFVRASTDVPARLLGVRYNDRAGLLAMGVPVDPPCDAACREAELRKTASPFPACSGRYAKPPRGWRD